MPIVVPELFAVVILTIFPEIFIYVSVARIYTKTLDEHGLKPVIETTHIPFFELFVTVTTEPRCSHTRNASMFLFTL
jgi:hypothetical protein